MKKVFGYIRVSTAKQGEGVSLIEQKEAISRYAEKYSLEIIQWFEEKETAAKQGRPLFNKMMKSLKQKTASGVVIHKIDRSARNLKDWADLGNLIDQGIEVHFAHESLDLQARGGRLSADIQAVIAADYIRNLRQEAIKGIYGRLKQGIYPFYAPIGYLNMGRGKPKTIDPVQGPLVKKAFELYATRKYSLHELTDQMFRLGLRNVRGQKVKFNSISVILNNSFYIGIIKVKGMTFNGIHEPIVSPRLFKQVQAILKGKLNQRVLIHDFKFRKMIKCHFCSYSLIGETQKGHIYYRCHTQNCATKGVRETSVESFLLQHFSAAELQLREYEELDLELKAIEQNWDLERNDLLKSLTLQLGQVEQRVERLTDCYVEGGLDKEMFENRKAKLLMEKKEKQEQERQLKRGDDKTLKKLKNFLELVKSLTESYKTGILEEQRELIEIVTSNLALSGKKLMISMRSPFLECAKRFDFLLSAHNHSTSRIKGCENLTSVSIGALENCEADNNVKIRKPLTRKQLKRFLGLLIQKAKEGTFPELPNEVEYQDDS